MRSLEETSKKFFVTIDIENDLGTVSEEKTFRGINEGLSLFLEILDDLNVSATFFFVGEVAENFPEVVKEVNKRHEVACHGLYHEVITKLDVTTRYRYVNRNVRIIQEITNRKPLGFRAVNFVTDNNIFSMLDELDFKYDSSVLPAYPLFRKYEGFKGKAPNLPYNPSRSNYRKAGDLKIIEMPVSVLPIFNLPWVGTHIRMRGKSIYKLSASLYKPSYILLVLHSWDFIELKGKTSYSRNSGKVFAKILKDLLLYLIEKGYIFPTLTEGSTFYQNEFHYARE